MNDGFQEPWAARDTTSRQHFIIPDPKINYRARINAGLCVVGLIGVAIAMLILSRPGGAP